VQATQLADELRATAIVVDSPLADGVDSPAPVIRCPLPHRHQLRRALGVADYLVKPVSRSELRLAIDRLGRAPRRVLVVDDDLRAVRLMTRMLQSCGYQCEVQSAHNGDEALAAMRANHPDLVILDLMMPGLSGQEVLDTMAGEPSLAELPVVVVSARGPDEERLPLHGELAVSKTEGMQMSELLDAIEAILGTLKTPRAYLTATEPGPAASPSGLAA
jgi:CheY-like chemotaxis protein